MDLSATAIVETSGAGGYAVPVPTKCQKRACPLGAVAVLSGNVGSREIRTSRSFVRYPTFLDGKIDRNYALAVKLHQCGCLVRFTMLNA